MNAFPVRLRPLPPAQSSRGPCPDPSRNYVRSGTAPTPTQTVTAAIFLRFPHGHSPSRHPVLLIIYRVSLPSNCPASLRPTAARPVENIPLQAEHHSGRRAKLFAFPPESRSPSTGFPAFQSDPGVVDGKSQQCPRSCSRKNRSESSCAWRMTFAFSGLERNAMNSKNGLRVGRTLPISSKAGTGASLVFNHVSPGPARCVQI